MHSTFHHRVSTELVVTNRPHEKLGVWYDKSVGLINECCAFSRYLRSVQFLKRWPQFAYLHFNGSYNLYIEYAVRSKNSNKSYVLKAYILSMWLGADWKLECFLNLVYWRNSTMVEWYIWVPCFLRAYLIYVTLRSDVVLVIHFDMLTQCLLHTWQQQYVLNTQMNLTVAVSDTNLLTYA